MMTKYVLHGGATRKDTESNTKFFQESVLGVPEPVKILLVNFAADKDRWDELSDQKQRQFCGASPEKELVFQSADENPERFIEQISWADVIFLRGGSDERLRRFLCQIPDLKKLWDGKVVAGSSAGANQLSRYYYSTDHNKIEEGLGFLPIKVFSHYDESRAEELRALESCGEKLVVHTIKETEYVVIRE